MAGRDEMLRRQRVLADFGDFVLDHEDLDEVLNEGCRLIAEALHADLAKVVEIERETNTGIIRAGVGWRPGIVGRERVSLSERSSEAFAIEQTQPVITNDIAQETRFEFPSFLRDHGVVALVNVPIFLPGRRPWGVLQVDARERREFGDEDIEFLKTYAMVLGPVIDRIRTAQERQRAEDDVRSGEARYRALFEQMDEAYAVVEVLRDEAGRPNDFLFLEVNPAFMQHTGMPYPVGRTAIQILGEPNPRWAEVYARVADTGEPARWEETEFTLGRVFDLNAFRLGDGGSQRVAVLFTNITKRKQTEAALRESEERQAFLLRLSDLLRPLADPVEIHATASRLTAEHLGIGRVAYCEVRYEPELAVIVERDWPRRGMPSIASGRYRLADFGPFLAEELAAGRAVAVAEAGGDPRLSEAERDQWRSLAIVASCAIPVIKQGRLVAYLAAQDNRRHDWTGQEVELLRDVSERTWASIERAKAETALRESQARLTAAFESVPVGVAVMDASGAAVVWNAEFTRFLPTGKMPSRDPERIERWRAWDAEGRPLDPQEFPGARALRGERVVPGQEMLYTDDSGREIWTSVATVPIRDEGDVVTGLATVITDIDARKRAVERQKLLLAELQHRVRNILAMVRSIVRRTVERGDNVQDVANHLEGRLASLARTQTMLTHAPGAGVSLETLIREELLAQNADEDLITLDGPEIELSPKAAEVLTLAIHELATNATKYGAFAQAGATLELRWRVEQTDEGRDRLRLLWQERGVRILSAEPRRAGFGTELIRRRVPHELRGTGTLELLPGGIRAEIAFPLSPGPSILATDAPGELTGKGEDT